MRLLLVTVLLLLLVPACFASQSPGHIYVALKAYEQAPAALKQIIEANQAAYLAGATGPDICLTTYLAAEGLGYEHPGSEAHYDRTGQLITNMLKLAAQDPDEASRNRGLAFALGWLTHYCTDCVIHGLVNDFGGYFGAGGDFIVRHKHLELVECEHVFQKNYGNLDDYAISPSAVPAELITAAFHETFPEKMIYKPITQYTALAFTDDLRKSALLMAGAGGWLLARHRNQTAYTGPIFSTVLKGNPPTADEYKALMDPLKIDEVKLEEPDRAAGETEGRLVVNYTLEDLGLYKLFCQQWNTRIGTAVGNADTAFGNWVADPQSFKMFDRNLDTGGPIASTYDTAKAWPGQPDINNMLAFVEIKNPEGKDVSPWDKTGQWVPVPLKINVGGPRDLVGLIEKRTGWNGGVAGRAFFKVPFDCSKGGEYNAKIRIVLANNADKRPYGWAEQGQTVEANWSGSLSGNPETSILFLVDCSGSMSGAKLAGAIAAIKASVDQTNDKRTEWCLARFGGCNVRVVSKFTMDPDKMKAAADTLGADGDTPMAYGREKALAYLVTKGRGKTGRMVILCDGQNNCPEHGGITQPEASAQLQKLMRIVSPAAMPAAQGGQAK